MSNPQVRKEGFWGELEAGVGYDIEPLRGTDIYLLALDFVTEEPPFIEVEPEPDEPAHAFLVGEVNLALI